MPKITIAVLKLMMIKTLKTEYEFMVLSVESYINLAFHFKFKLVSNIVHFKDN